MKTRLTVATSLMCSYFLFFVGQSAMATNYIDVTESSNVFASRAHVNLKIYDKDANTYACNSTSGGKSGFINEVGQSTGQYVSNRLSTVTELTALDLCAPKRMTVHRLWSSFPMEPKAAMPLLALGEGSTMAPTVW